MAPDACGAGLSCLSGCLSALPWRPSPTSSGKPCGPETPASRAGRAVRVILGHVAPARIRVALPDDGDRSWTGAKIWPSGMVLADWLARQLAPGALAGARVLELGCGSAPLAAAVAALGGAKTVEATDGDPTAVRAAEENLAGCAELGPRARAPRPRVWQLDWEEAIRGAAAKGGYEVILFADAVYTEDHATALADCIEYCLAASPEARVYGAFAETRTCAAEFCREMKIRGLVAEKVDLGSSAEAAYSAVEAFENCTRDEAMHKGPCVLVTWRRRQAGVRDETDQIARAFDHAVGAAERAVEERLQKLGYTPCE